LKIEMGLTKKLQKYISMEKKIQKSTMITAVMVAVLIVGVFAVWSWREMKEKELKIRAIDDCAKVAANAQSGGGFNGAVYKVCVEDKGYVSTIQ